MRALYGQGTPREAAETLYALTIVLRTETALVFALIATVDGQLAAIVIVLHTRREIEKPGLHQRAVKSGLQAAVYGAWNFAVVESDRLCDI